MHFHLLHQTKKRQNLLMTTTNPPEREETGRHTGRTSHTGQMPLILKPLLLHCRGNQGGVKCRTRRHLWWKSWIREPYKLLGTKGPGPGRTSTRFLCIRTPYCLTLEWNSPLHLPCRQSISTPTSQNLPDQFFLVVGPTI